MNHKYLLTSYVHTAPGLYPPTTYNFKVPVFADSLGTYTHIITEHIYTVYTDPDRHGSYHIRRRIKKELQGPITLPDGSDFKLHITSNSLIKPTAIFEALGAEYHYVVAVDAVEAFIDNLGVIASVYEAVADLGHVVKGPPIDYVTGAAVLGDLLNQGYDSNYNINDADILVPDDEIIIGLGPLITTMPITGEGTVAESEINMLHLSVAAGSSVKNCKLKLGQFFTFELEENVKLVNLDWLSLPKVDPGQAVVSNTEIINSSIIDSQLKFVVASVNTTYNLSSQIRCSIVERSSLYNCRLNNAVVKSCMVKNVTLDLSNTKMYTTTLSSEDPNLLTNNFSVADAEISNVHVKNGVGVTCYSGLRMDNLYIESLDLWLESNAAEPVVAPRYFTDIKAETISIMANHGEFSINNLRVASLDISGTTALSSGRVYIDNFSMEGNLSITPYDYGSSVVACSISNCSCDFSNLHIIDGGVFANIDFNVHSLQALGYSAVVTDDTLTVSLAAHHYNTELKTPLGIPTPSLKDFERTTSGYNVVRLLQGDTGIYSSLFTPAQQTFGSEQAARLRYYDIYYGGQEPEDEKLEGCDG